MREVRAAVQAAGVDLIVARRKVGVLVFGPDDAARRAFGPYGIASFDLHAIPLGRLAYESAEQGLLTEAVARGLTRERPLQAIHRRSGYVVTVDPARQGEPLLRPLADVTGSLVGTVPNSATTQSRTWREAVSIRLEQRYGRLWLLIEPTIWVERAPGEPLDDTSKEFVRARLAQRYNAKVNALLDAWTSVVTGGAAQATLLAFGDIEGVNAGFTVHKTAAFSRRISGRRSRHHANGGSA